MKSLLRICAFTFVLLGSAQAISGTRGNLNYFYDRFEITQREVQDPDNPEEVTLEKVIIDKRIRRDLDFAKYMEFTGSFWLENKDRNEYLDYNCAANKYDKPRRSLPDPVEEALDVVRDLDLGKILQNKKFQKAVSIIQRVADNFVLRHEYEILVNLENPRYFFEQSIGPLLGSELEGIIFDHLDPSGTLAYVLFLRDNFNRYILQKKEYSQTMLLYYLENYPAEALGLTESERTRAISSYYDSLLRLGGLSFGGFRRTFKSINTSNRIASNYEGYGVRRLENHRNAAIRSSQYEDNINIFGDSISFANSFFANGSTEQGQLLVNFKDTRKYKSRNPAVTYDRQCGDYLYLKRRSQLVADFGLEVAPIPYMKQAVKLIFRSWYKNLKFDSQVISEGYLYGHLRAIGDHHLANEILRQSLNPLMTR